VDWEPDAASQAPRVATPTVAVVSRGCELVELQNFKAEVRFSTLALQSSSTLVLWGFRISEHKEVQKEGLKRRRRQSSQLMWFFSWGHPPRLAPLGLDKGGRVAPCLPRETPAFGGLHTAPWNCRHSACGSTKRHGRWEVQGESQSNQQGGSPISRRGGSPNGKQGGSPMYPAGRESEQQECGKPSLPTYYQGVVELSRWA
jgi:hypothetical protein